MFSRPAARRMGAALFLPAALLLSACAERPEMLASPPKAAGTVPVDETFSIWTNTWTSGEEYIWYHKVMRPADRNVICLAVTMVAGNGFFSDMFQNKVLGGTQVVVEGKTVLDGVIGWVPVKRAKRAEPPEDARCFDAGPHDGSGRKPSYQIQPPRYVKGRG